MPRERKLKAALDRYTGVNHKLERQKKLQKEAGKRKKQKKFANVDVPALEDAVASEEEDEEAQALASELREREKEEKAAKKASKAEQGNGQADGWETEESEAAEDDEDDEDGITNGGGIEIGQLSDESDSDSEDDVGANGVVEHDEDDEDIPFSDIESLASADRADVIPHQRMTINNTAALQRSLKSFQLSSSLSFSAVQSVTSVEPVEIKDVEDDLNRELAFYRQALDAVTEGRSRLKKEGVSFSRPVDYFAEMVKSEEQMGKVRAKLLDEAARKKASSDARRQRDLKKFGKAVQVAKLQERQKEKRDTLDRINTLKRKRQGADLTANENDMFDVALEDAGETAKSDRAARRAKGAAEGPNRKRQKKDEKFGFGGKKRFAKSNDAKSTNEMSGYSVRNMKGGKPGKQRPGKSKRAKMSDIDWLARDRARQVKWSVITGLVCCLQKSASFEMLAVPARATPNTIDVVHTPRPQLSSTTTEQQHIMGAWGYGLFQSDHDFDIIDDLNGEAGVFKLEEQAIAREKAKKRENGVSRDAAKGSSDDEGVHYSIFADVCSDVVAVRNHLETTGILQKLIQDGTARALAPRDGIEFNHPGIHHPGYKLVLLGACTMTLGCTLQPDFLQVLRDIFTGVGLMPDALKQMDKALNGPNGFKNTEMYDFESAGLLETANMSTSSGGPKSSPLGFIPLNVPAPHGFFKGPDTTALEKEIKVRMAAAKEEKTKDVCGGCGATEDKTGTLLVCVKCKKRKYCSRECQKAQWKTHKLICTPPPPPPTSKAGNA